MISIKNIEKNMVSSQEEEVSIKQIVRPRRKGFAGKFAFLLFIAVIVLLALYLQQKREVTRLTDPVAQTEYAEKQVQKVIDDLKKYVVVPDDEELKLLGVINDPDTLKKDQAFYANVERGDYVFLFSKSSRALIWRPDAKKIVNFGVADTTKSQQSVQSPTTPTAPATTTDDKKAQ